MSAHGPRSTISDGPDAVLDNHRVRRDGSYWVCMHCGVQWPFPAPLPSAPGPCVPRRWGDDLPPAQPPRLLPDLYDSATGQRTPLSQPCPTCRVAAGQRCWDLRGYGRTSLRPHPARRVPQ